MPLSDLQPKLQETLGRAVEHLYSNRIQGVHWGDYRSTALAAWALHEVVRGRNVRPEVVQRIQELITDALRWLAAQAKPVEGGYCWDAEAWDTSLSVIALSAADYASDRIDQAIAWLYHIRCPRTKVWYDEIWESVLCAIALIHAERRRKGPKRALAGDIAPVIDWLVDIPAKPSGEFVNPHYSAFLCWLSAEIYSVGLSDELRSYNSWPTFEAKVVDAARWLSDAASKDPKNLWCPYTFANAYILYALCRASAHHSVPGHYLKPAVDWLAFKQGKHGGFEDIEDTALAVLALSLVTDRPEIDPELLTERINRLPTVSSGTKQHCFFGYCGGSSAVAAQLKDFLRHEFPGLELRDWKWDFQYGGFIFHELEQAAEICQCAILLVTKDDFRVTNQGAISVPRDNVVLEMGFFAGALRRENVILIVEQGVNLPTDLGGLIYIGLRGPSEIDSIHTQLRNHLRQIMSRQPR